MVQHAFGIYKSYTLLYRSNLRYVVNILSAAAGQLQNQLGGRLLNQQCRDLRAKLTLKRSDDIRVRRGS